MKKWKQGKLFDEDEELRRIQELERQLEEAQREYSKLPAKLARQREEREATMPPMAEIAEREEFNKFEQNLSRGQIENVLRAQRHSLRMMLLLLAALTLMLWWMYEMVTR